MKIYKAKNFRILPLVPICKLLLSTPAPTGWKEGFYSLDQSPAGFFSTLSINRTATGAIRVLPACLPSVTKGDSVARFSHFCN